MVCVLSVPSSPLLEKPFSLPLGWPLPWTQRWALTQAWPSHAFPGLYTPREEPFPCPGSLLGPRHLHSSACGCPSPSPPKDGWREPAQQEAHPGRCPKWVGLPPCCSEPELEPNPPPDPPGTGPTPQLLAEASDSRVLPTPHLLAEASDSRVLPLSIGCPSINTSTVPPTQAKYVSVITQNAEHWDFVEKCCHPTAVRCWRSSGTVSEPKP